MSTVKKEIERARTIHKYHWENQKTLARESLMVDEWSIFSPFSTYQVLSYQLARTTLDDKFYLTKAGRRYRETYIQYLRGKNAFGSRRWFTDDPEDQEPMIPHPEEVEPEMLVPDAPFMKARMDWVQQQEKKASRDARRQLDLTDLPKFGEKWQRSLAESFAIMTPGLAVLLLSFGLSVLFATLRFLRYDPR